jgi:adenylate cyclase class 2
MCVEIEAKLKVDSLADVERRLNDLGAEFVAEQSQSDDHFDDANATLATTDRCLRLRRQSIGPDEKFFLTHKGAKESSNFKKRREIELEICDADVMSELLAALGYKKVLVVEKTRRLWRFRGCEVALDHLPQIGDFVEIEGPDDEMIAKVQQSLGLAHLQHVAKSYAQMIAEKLNKPDVNPFTNKT